MEELRPVLADRLALTLINRGQIKADDFIIDEGGAVSLTEDGRKTVLVAWQDRKKRDLRHPFLGETRSEEHTSELQSLMRISYAVFCLKKKNNNDKNHSIEIKMKRINNK